MTGRPVTIAVVYSHLLNVGGIETHLLSLLRHHDQARYRWCILAPTSPEFAAQAQALGAHVVSWRPTNALDARALTSLVRLLRGQHTSLVHPHNPLAALYGRLAAWWLRLPTVVTVHLPLDDLLSRPHARTRSLYRWVERVLNYGFTHRLIYVSPRLGQAAAAASLAPRARVRVIENGIDLSLYSQTTARQSIRQAFHLSGETPVLCCVARLEAQKGIDLLLEALSLLNADTCDWQLWLVGDGQERAGLEAQSRRLGLKARVKFLGYRSDVPNLLQAADVFVLPSRFEAMPIALLEAMAAGLPSVVTDVGENAHLVESGLTGIVAPPTNVPDLARALRELLTSAELRQRMGQAARRKAQAYGDEHMAEQTYAVYDSLLHS